MSKRPVGPVEHMGTHIASQDDHFIDVQMYVRDGDGEVFELNESIALSKFMPVPDEEEPETWGGKN